MDRQGQPGYTDEELIARMRAAPNDEVARQVFDQLYERHADSLLRNLIALVGDKEAEDLAQDAWLRAWKHFRGPGPALQEHFRGWIFRVAQNLFLDRARKKRPFGTISLDPPDEKAPGTLEELLDRERMEKLAECLGKLEPRKAQAFRLRCEGLDCEAIALAMQATIDAVYALLFKAKQQLAECVQRALS
jgi:RNA polymerase sigma factor (sigma-70 family)